MIKEYRTQYRFLKLFINHIRQRLSEIILRFQQFYIVQIFKSLFFHFHAFATRWILKNCEEDL